MELPTRIGRYVVEELLGRGGMAEVFRARLDDGGFEKVVCMKRVLPQLAGQAGFFDMLRDEAQLAARLTHPHLVQAFDLVRDEGSLWLVLELVDGTNLKQVLQVLRNAGEPMRLTQALHIAMCVSRGLHHAHTARSPRGEPLCVVHRDVSPDNVLLGCAGEVKLADFGIARASERLAERTATGVMKGKPGYMAPEQILGEALDHRVDQFTLASVLWEMLAGRPLFAGKGEMERAEAVLSCIVPSLPEGIPASVEATLHRALSRAPANRFADMAAFEGELSRDLYACVKTSADVDVGALVARVRLESGETTRVVRAPVSSPGIDGAAAGESPPFSDVTFERATPGLFADEKTQASAAPLGKTTVPFDASALGDDDTPLEKVQRTPARPQASERRLWALVGATVAVGAMAAVVTAALAVRSMTDRSVPGSPVASSATNIPAVLGVVESRTGPTAPVDELLLLPAPVPDGANDVVSLVRPTPRPTTSPATARKRAMNAQLDAARTQLLAGHVEEAVALLKDVVAADPLNAEAHLALGVSYGKLDDARRAAAHFRMYLGLRPDAVDRDAVQAAISRHTR